MAEPVPGERRMGASSLARLLGEWRPPGERGLGAALTERMRLLVLDGRVPLQTRLPAERELAGALGVSRTTVAGAYEALRESGYLHSRRGAGSWTRLPSGGSDPAAALSPFSPGHETNLADLAHAAAPAPCEAMRRAAAAAVTDLDAHIGGHGYSPYGLPVLREAVARRFTERGLPTTPDQVMITSGGMQAIALAMTLLVAPGERVLVEHPTYPNALDVVRARNARPVPVALTDSTSPWDPELFAAAVRDTAPTAAYVIPDFHNPTGAVLDQEGRTRLVELARRTRTPLVVDETMTDLALDGPVPVPAAAHGAADSPLVLTVGSASKVFWGGLRVGWLRGTPGMIGRLAALRPSMDLGGAVLDQLVTARLLAEVDTIAAERRAMLRAARDALRGRLAELLPAWRPNHPPGGLSLWVDLGAPVSSTLAGAARRHGLLLAAGPRFGVDGAFERFLRVPYALRPDQWDVALERLTRAWHALGVPAAEHPPRTQGETEHIAVA